MRERIDEMLIKKSKYFDEQWYLNSHPDVKRSGIEPAIHFLRVGTVLRRDPGPGFSTVEYLEKHPDCADAGMNPLVHLACETRNVARSLPDGGRVAVFASFSIDGQLPPQVLPYLEGLALVCSAIIVVFDNDLNPDELARLAPYATHVITGRHGEYDFGSYKRGFAWAQEHTLLDGADALIFCNDSCFGPIGSFEPMFRSMEARQLDFWGVTDSIEFSYHLQTYFVVFNRPVFTSAAFIGFIGSIQKKPSVREVILDYELGLTATLNQAGFQAGALVPNRFKGVHPSDTSYRNLLMFPLYQIEHGAPLVKVKALRHAHANLDGPNRTLDWLKANAPDIYETAIWDLEVSRFMDATDVAFSLIMPTRNRAWCIARAIESVLAQTHRNFELVVVDDGSTDNSEALIAESYPDEIATGRIRYVRLAESLGVCDARNLGLVHARNPWIGYVDSDNRLRPYFLTMFANAVVEYDNLDAFYARIINLGDGAVIGRPFNAEALRSYNFIDLGAFVHRRALIARFGGFDPALRRLVDWDLVIRYTHHKSPAFISRTVMDYADGEDPDRISNRESRLKADIAVKSKHSHWPTVTTAIVTYNQQRYVAEAIESALAQSGKLNHEILLSDDGSTDGTQRIVARYAEKYPKQIRNISRGRNFGVSENYRHCFREAAGNFVAILEGDDYWTNPEKNLRQAEFLVRHPEAPMVFSRIELLDTASGKRRLLRRQDGIAGDFVTGEEFSQHEQLNLIGNISSIMFRGSVLAGLPSWVYKPRLNEITLAFYLDRIGPIGFINEVMGTYRVTSSGVWQGASQASKLEQAIEARESALHLAKARYRPAIRQRLEEEKKELASPRSAKHVSNVN